jgi:T3SS negative regulator,GrlR
LFDGFYTVRFQLGEAVGRSVMYARDGKLLGGNSAFAHIGTYEELGGDEIAIVVNTVRHNPDPNYKAMAGTDDATLLARGRPDGDLYRFEGRLRELPDVPFKSVMTPVEDQPQPIAGGVGEGGVVDGLYSIHLRLLDGVDGGLTGVMLLKAGRILGGDASFYYVGSYTSANGRWKGQILNQEHTPAKGQNPVFGGHEVGIGFSGTCDQDGALLEATALAGKRSLRLTAVLKLMRRA